MKIRGFEVVTKYKNAGINIPKRSTEHSAGYDIEAAETVSFAPGEIKLIPTGLKAYMQSDEVLYMYDRSSNPRKKCSSRVRFYYSSCSRDRYGPIHVSN